MIIEKFVDEIHMQRYKTLLDKAGDEPNKETACLFYVISSNDKLFEDVNKIYDFMNAVIKVYKRFKLSIQDKKMYNLALQLYDESLNHSSIHEIFKGLDERNEEIAIRAIHYKFSENEEELKKSPAKARDID